MLLIAIKDKAMWGLLFEKRLATFDLNCEALSRYRAILRNNVHVTVNSKIIFITVPPKDPLKIVVYDIGNGIETLFSSGFILLIYWKAICHINESAQVHLAINKC